MNKQYKFSFQITQEQGNRIKALPRSIKLSEKLRAALDTILSDVGQSALVKEGIEDKLSKEKL